MDNSNKRYAARLDEMGRKLRINTDGIIEGARRLYDRNKHLMAPKSYRAICREQAEPSWLRVMRENGCGIVVAKRLGPDGENFYEPEFK